MRRRASVVIALAATLVGCDEGTLGAVPDAGDPAPWLRLNHIQMRGTHNSYHLAPDHPVLDAFAHSQPPLRVQLAAHGVRQLEFDVYEGVEGTFPVYHLPGIDERSLCPTLRACLAEVEAWSSANPTHHALIIFIEPKTDLSRSADRLDQAILDVWPRDRIVSPADMRGEHRDLQTAVDVVGWPSLHASRGKALFMLFDDGRPRANYLEANVEPLMFVRTPMGEQAPYAAFFNNDVIDVGAFQQLMDAGFLSRTRGDEMANRDAALSGGAHIISLDDAGALELPGGSPSRCNPYTAPPGCRPELIEPR